MHTLAHACSTHVCKAPGLPPPIRPAQVCVRTTHRHTPSCRRICVGCLLYAAQRKQTHWLEEEECAALVLFRTPLEHQEHQLEVRVCACVCVCVPE